MEWIIDHQMQVTYYSCLIGDRLKLSKEESYDLFVASNLHDIGKVKVPNEVLCKKEKLNDEEMAIIKKHTLYGAEILKGKEYNSKIINAVLYHHEKYDGTGYNKLKGKEIPLLSRIISIADTFDAITSNRPYRNSSNIEYAMKEIVTNSGTQFDPELVNIFDNMMKCLVGNKNCIALNT